MEKIAGMESTANNISVKAITTTITKIGVINNLPVFKQAVITIGSFDGVHLGHKKLINKVNRLARSTGGESVLITFHPHPRQIVFPGDDFQLLSTIEEKIILLVQ